MQRKCFGMERLGGHYRVFFDHCDRNISAKRARPVEDIVAHGACVGLHAGITHRP
jgi:hypothetical protein